jgi:hypothetical protein
MKYQGLREFYKITEYRDGCVYKTKPIGFYWITLGKNIPQWPDTQYISVSTDIMRKYRTNRTVTDDTLDIVETKLSELQEIK